jgi:hypothetical protein
MSVSKRAAETFQAKLCRHFEISPEHYGDTVLRLTLYRHAQWLRLFGSGELLSADRDFIHAVGQLTRWPDFAGAARNFQLAPQNRLFWRRSLRLRVSVGRMRVLFSEVWGESVPATEELPPVDLSHDSSGLLPD